LSDTVHEILETEGGPMRTRLTLPMRFANEKRALGVIRDNSLFTVGRWRSPLTRPAWAGAS
jgi:hypothetical protein